MKFGIGIVGEHRPQQLIELVKQLETLGFDMAWFTDERFHRDVFVNMTLAADHSDYLRIGCMVTDPFIRHPALTAVAGATLDELSGERFTLGMGAGISGFGELGIRRHRPALAIREAIELMNRLTAGERDVMFEGEIIQFGPGQLDFTPTRRMPIYVAGRGPRVLQAAGAVADGVVIASHATEAGIAWSLKHVNRGAGKAGRRLDALHKISWLYTSVAPDREAARDAVRIGVAVAMCGSREILEQIGVQLPKEVQDFMDSHAYRFDRTQMAELGALIPDELLDQFSLAGTVTEVVDKLAEIRELGFHQAALWPFPTRGSNLSELIDVLGKQVLPTLKT